MKSARSTERLEQLEHRALLRSPRESLFPMRERREIFSETHDAVCLALWPRTFCSREGRRKRGSHDQAERHDVVVRNPLAQGDHAFAQRRRIIGDFYDSLRFLPEPRIVRRSEADSDVPPVLERND